MNTAPIIKPPFTLESALKKVQLAEDAWNSRDPERVALAYSAGSEWRNRSEFLRGREEIKAFLYRKWAKELDYRLEKTLWAFHDNRIAGASNTNGATIRTSGIAPTGTNFGNSMRMA